MKHPPYVAHAMRGLSSSALETKRMNLFTAINDGMRVAMETDDSAVVFGEVRDRCRILGANALAKMMYSCCYALGCCIWWRVPLQC